MNETESPQSDIWPPEPTAQPVLIEIGPYQVQVTSDCLQIKAPVFKKSFWIRWGLLLLQALLLLCLIQQRLMPPGVSISPNKPLVIYFFWAVTLLGVSWSLRKGIYDRAKPLMADRALNTLRINDKKTHSLSDLVRIELSPEPNQHVWFLFAVVADQRHTEKMHRLGVAADKTQEAMQHLADVIAEFAGVPVEVQ